MSVNSYDDPISDEDEALEPAAEAAPAPPASPAPIDYPHASFRIAEPSHPEGVVAVYRPHADHAGASPVAIVGVPSAISPHPVMPPSAPGLPSSGAFDPSLAIPRPIPKPRPVIVPERTDKGFRTASISIERSGSRDFYVTCAPPDRGPFRAFVNAAAMESLLAIATSPAWEPGTLWRRFCLIPLERPLPSRALEEELRILLTNYAPDLRR